MSVKAYFQQLLQEPDLMLTLSDLGNVSILIFLFRSIYQKKTASGLSFQSHYSMLLVYFIRYIISIITPDSLVTLILRSLCFTGYLSLTLIFLTKMASPTQKRYDTFKFHYVFLIGFALSLTFNNGNFSKNFFIELSYWIDSISLFSQVILLQNTHRSGIIDSRSLIFLTVFRVFASLFAFSDTFKKNHINLTATSFFLFGISMFSLIFYIHTFRTQSTQRFTILEHFH